MKRMSQCKQATLESRKDKKTFDFLSRSCRRGRQCKEDIVEQGHRTRREKQGVFNADAGKCEGATI